VESLLREAEVSSLETRVWVERAITFDPIVGSPQIFTGVSGSCFSWSRCGIATREAEVSSLETRVPVRKDHNF